MVVHGPGRKDVMGRLGKVQGSSGGSGGHRAQYDGGWDDGSEGLRGQQETQFPKIFSGQHQNRATSFNSPGKINIEWTTTGPMPQVYVRKSGGVSAGVVVSESGLSGTSPGGSDGQCGRGDLLQGQLAG